MECEANILVKVVGLFGFVLEFLKEQAGDRVGREIAFQLKFF